MVAAAGTATVMPLILGARGVANAKKGLCGHRKNLLEEIAVKVVPMKKG